ncbi:MULTISPECIES: long-chain-fatty-acid--CoA ligase [unclassified Sphingomonas]|uniref:long-chain-fatty-acid--CoA ligase n=1 Tax=unclassified Sphingomonas TaxID=196159 RepID=UPI0006FC2A28|nr:MULTISPECIES: long-chain-fatty-acid--CoA ligase [unclassified Sphingomonas]KQX23256.1 long-chain fatty acid--CoA ligase [Sphingomonas sp. Root1294]KQY68104.1 long-chain fatty acid--CoA ligase [Sphingomonas sp. Root50]KRB90995.1 long-chain fatty acid--CoA ligase [Sphingomonas sp. Root720]
MFGLMQEGQLTLDALLSHAARWHGGTEVVWNDNQGARHRTVYADCLGRAKQVSNALLAAGIRLGDRIGTLGWNSAQHFEAWYGTVAIGAVCHTLNPRLLPDQIGYLVRHAGNRVIFADSACLSILETILPACPMVEQVIFFDDETICLIDGSAVSVDGFSAWIGRHGADCDWGGFDERTAAGLCYTSGTTGNPKGVLYSHRSNYLHSLITCQADGLNLASTDTVLLLVPMYHANAWGLVYSAPMAGARLVLPGQRVDGATLYELIESEGVTFAAGVPTVWQGLLKYCRETGSRLTRLKRAVVAGSVCPETIVREFLEHDVEVLHAWGMTEASPLATLSSPDREVAAMPLDDRIRYSLKQGRTLPGVDLKLTDDHGRRLPHDGRTPGRLHVKGETIVGAYFGQEDIAILDGEGFFDTGDIATIDHRGYMQITDRAKDVIKSGGEWISSVDLETIALGHPKAELCAVIGVPHPKWDERPLLLMKLKGGAVATAEEILAYLDGKIAKWWMPDEVRFVDEIPLGATGKIDKKKLRDSHST